MEALARAAFPFRDNPWDSIWRLPTVPTLRHGGRRPPGPGGRLFRVTAGQGSVPSSRTRALPPPTYRLQSKVRSQKKHSLVMRWWCYLISGKYLMKCEKSQKRVGLAFLCLHIDAFIIRSTITILIFTHFYCVSCPESHLLITVYVILINRDR